MTGYEHRILMVLKNRYIVVMSFGNVSSSSCYLWCCGVLLLVCYEYIIYRAIRTQR